MIRVAAVGDVHYDVGSKNRLASYFKKLGEKADLLLVAGDITQTGALAEARAFAADLKLCPVPVVSVLGNHDYHNDEQECIRAMLRDSGVIALEGSAVVLEIRNYRVGVAGIKGFGGGFTGGFCSDFGEAEVKSFARHARRQSELLMSAIEGMDVDFKFVLLHYSPVESTLIGERRDIYPFLGSYLLAEVIDAYGADAVFHGHAHYGIERGSTSGGIPVRNVAQTVIRHAYNVYSFELPA